MTSPQKKPLLYENFVFVDELRWNGSDGLDVEIGVTSQSNFALFERSRVVGDVL